MPFWDTVTRCTNVCSISLRDLFASPAPELPELPAGERSVRAGNFRYDKSVPVLSVTGSHAALGFQEGSLLEQLMGPFLEHYLTSALGRNRRKWKELQQRAVRCREFLPDRFLTEMHALANTSGIPADRPLMASVFLDFYSMVLCSCISIAREASSTNRFMMGRNLDFPTMGVAHRYTLLKAVDPDDHYRHVHLTWPGLTGVLTGMNEHGLTIALLEVDGAEPFGPGLPYTLMQRRILEECRTIDETEQLLRSVSRTRSNNLMVADGSGKAAVFEYDRCGVTRRTSQQDWIYATNHFVSSSRRNQPISLKYFSAVRRYRLIERARGKNSQLRENELFQLLERLALGRLNLAAMILYPLENKIDLRIGAPPAARRRTKRLDLMPYLGDETESEKQGVQGKFRVEVDR